MSDLVKFRIPAAFVLTRLLPTPDELVYGHRHGWIGEADVIALALAMYEAGSAPPAVEDLALLLSDESSRVDQLIEDAGRATMSETAPARAWLFLALAWVHDGDGDLVDPHETVELLHADFDYPQAMEPFVRFMPAPPGQPTGMAAIDARWRAYLAAEAAWFRARRDQQERGGPGASG